MRLSLPWLLLLLLSRQTVLALVEDVKIEETVAEEMIVDEAEIDTESSTAENESMPLRFLRRLNNNYKYNYGNNNNYSSSSSSYNSGSNNNYSTYNNNNSNSNSNYNQNSSSSYNSNSSSSYNSNSNSNSSSSYSNRSQGSSGGMPGVLKFLLFGFVLFVCLFGYLIVWPVVSHRLRPKRTFKSVIGRSKKRRANQNDEESGVSYMNMDGATHMTKKKIKVWTKSVSRLANGSSR